MSNRGKTLVKGHVLLFEGKPCGNTIYQLRGFGFGKCSCGLSSERLGSNAARKRWHKQHKADVLEEQEGREDTAQ